MTYQLPNRQQVNNQNRTYLICKSKLNCFGQGTLQLQCMLDPGQTVKLAKAVFSTSPHSAASRHLHPQKPGTCDTHDFSALLGGSNGHVPAGLQIGIYHWERKSCQGQTGVLLSVSSPGGSPLADDGRMQHAAICSPANGECVRTQQANPSQRHFSLRHIFNFSKPPNS